MITLRAVGNSNCGSSDESFGGPTVARPTSLRTRNTFARRRRSGYTLVFVAMFLFGIFALAALVIDLGFVRLAQSQLRDAADSAALEGLRGAAADANDDLVAYDDRRAAAREMVEWHFDDDLGATSAAGSGVGAGPLIEFTGGAGDLSLAASQKMQIDLTERLHRPVPKDGSPSADRLTFRLELTRGVETTPAADVYSTGPAVPYLFARGSFINRQLIQQGVAIRGPAQAGATPAVSVGLPVETVSPPVTGLLPLAFATDSWNSLSTGASSSISVDSDGNLAGGWSGRFYERTGVADAPTVVGRTIPPALRPADGVYSGYVPVFAAISVDMMVADRVVAFGRVTATLATSASDGSISVQVTRLPSVVAIENASAVLCFDPNTSDVALAEAMARRGLVDEPLLAPVLSR